MLLYDIFYYSVSSGKRKNSFDRDMPRGRASKGEVAEFVNTNWDRKKSYLTSDGEEFATLELALKHARANKL